MTKTLKRVPTKFVDTLFKGPNAIPSVCNDCSNPLVGREWVECGARSPRVVCLKCYPKVRYTRAEIIARTVRIRGVKKSEVVVTETRPGMWAVSFR